MSDSSQDPTETTPPVNITRLLTEAASKSGVMWVEVPGAGTHAVWFVWHDDGDERGSGPAAYVVSGDGEQALPPLPDEVIVVFRSKDTGGRLLRLRAAVSTIDPDSAPWEPAAEALRANRLNSSGDVLERWRTGATIHVLSPHGRPEEGPGSYGLDSGRAPVLPSAGTTARWRPWHWGGRGRGRAGSSPGN